jgi:hypothetical protein
MQRVSDVEFFYSHGNNECLLFDIPRLGFDHNSINNVKDSDGVVRVGDTTYINTWYGQQNHRYLKQYGITFDSLYTAFDDTCKNVFGFTLDSVGSPADFFPTIDYEKFEIGNVKNWIANNNNVKKILVDNGNVLSNQSVNFSFANIIMSLAIKHKNKIFILSQKENKVMPDNVFYTADIVGKSGNDLNEISYLSKFCDVIVGRAGGVFTFSLTKENMFERVCKYVCFSNLVPISGKIWVGSLLKDRINYSAKTITMNEYNISRVLNIIDLELI